MKSELDQFIEVKPEIWYIRANARTPKSHYTSNLSSNVIAHTVEQAIEKLRERYSSEYSNIKINSVSHKGTLDIW